MKSFFIALFAGVVAWSALHPVSAEDTATLKEKVLYSFCSQAHCADGSHPVGSLIDVKGVLYGTTAGGGGTGCNGSGCGTVFSIDPNTGTQNVLYSFCGKANCADGAIPAAGLINLKGTLYGTTQIGGAANSSCDSGCGTVFALNLKTGTETVLYSFCTQANCTDGVIPAARLTAVGGILYGTAEAGGTGDGGTAFSLDPSTGAEKTLYSFCSQLNCRDGRYPSAGLISVNGTLYGTTAYGGAGTCTGSGCGTVFSIDLNAGTETVLHSFVGGADGQEPFDSLTNLNGTLYGTTFFGGEPGCFRDGCGTVFSIAPGTGKEKVLYAFCQQENCPDGALPRSGLVDVKGTLYGTTAYGGRTGCPQTGDCGTVFSVDPNTGTETVLYAFCNRKNCTDGWGPEAGLVAAKGTLYGTTTEGGASGNGTAFALKTKH